MNELLSSGPIKSSSKIEVDPTSAPNCSSAVAWRIPALDAARFLAAVGVIWIHVPRSEALLPTSILGRFAVPFFAATAIFFVVRGVGKRPTQSLEEFTRDKLRRLYLPFLVWSGLYLLFKLAKAALLPHEANEFPGLEVLWQGGAYHLWFIPFLIATSIGMFVIAKLALPWIHAHHGYDGRCYMAALAVGVLVALIQPPVIANSTTTSSLSYMWEALPAVCWGFGLAIRPTPSAAQVGPSSRKVICVSWLFLVTMALLCLTGRNALLENYAGMLLLLASLELRSGRLLQWLAKLGPFALGIYFSHLMLLKVGESLAAKLGLSVTWQLDIALFASVLVGSLAVVISLVRCRATRWLVA